MYIYIYIYIYIIYLILTTFFKKSESEFKGHIVSCSLFPQICILWLNRMRVKLGVPYTRTGVILMEILNKNFNKLIIFNKSEKKLKSLSHVWLFATPWTVAHQAPPSMGFSFSRGSSQPRDRTQVCHIVNRHFNLWATREDYISISKLLIRERKCLKTERVAPGPSPTTCILR